MSLGFTILGEIFAYVTAFQSNHRSYHIPCDVIVYDWETLAHIFDSCFDWETWPIVLTAAMAGRL